MKKILSAILTAALLFSTSFIYAMADGVSITNLTPSNGSSFEIAQGTQFTISADVDGAALVKFLFCGELVAEFEDGDNFEYSISSDNMMIGKKNFTVVAFDEYGNEYSETAVFDIITYFNDSILPGISSEVQTFDDMGDKYVLADNKTLTPAEILSDFSNEFGWTLENSTTELNLSRMTGSSGKAGDYAVRIGRIKSGGGSNFKLNAWNRKPSGGIAVIEFDICAANSEHADTRISGVSHHSGNNLLYQGKIHNTGVTYSNNQWIKMKYEYNLDTGKISFWADGTKLVSDISASSTNSPFNTFGIGNGYWSAANYYITNGWAYIGIDNFRAYMKKGVYTVDSLGYIEDGNQFDSNGTIPFGTHTVTVNLTESGEGLSDSDVELFVNGKATAHEGVVQNGNTVQINLPSAIKAQSDIRVVINKTSDSDGSIVIPDSTEAFFKVGEEAESIYIFKKNDVEITSVTNCTAGDILSCEYVPIVKTDSSKKIVLVLAARSNGKLIQLCTKTIEADSDNASLVGISLKEMQKSYDNVELSLYAIADFGSNIRYN